jgi:hypothetical protein
MFVLSETLCHKRVVDASYYGSKEESMRVVSRVNVLAVCVITFLVVTGCGKKETPKGRVFFLEPKDGAEINGPVKVVMGVEGMEVKPAGEVIEGAGHHHILINKDFIPAGQVIPTDDADRHFGKGQTEAVLDLPPGDYKLTLQFADGLHRSYGKDLSATINIKVISK